MVPLSKLRAPTTLALFALLIGCAPTIGSAPRTAPTAPASATAAPPTPTTPVHLPAIVVSPFADAELQAMFEKGRVALAAERYPEALELFERLVRLAPNGEVAPPSLYNAAVAHDGLGHRELAVERLTELLTRFPHHATARGATFQLSRMQAVLERWEALDKTADKLLALTDLSVLEAIHAHGAKGLALVELGRVDDAHKELRKGIDLVEAHRLGDTGKPPLELAQLHFALGEVKRMRSERITFTPLPPNFADALEQRCQALMEAQTAYSEAMRSYDAQWSAMAGYRVGQLYQKLHEDVMRAPFPTAGGADKAAMFQGAMRLRYRVLLEKGISLMNATLKIGERTGEGSSWVGRAKEAKTQMEAALAAEKQALAKLPYTEEELRSALEKMKTKTP